jgi:hypothetical protein
MKRVLVVGGLFAAAMWAQDSITVSFSDPARPKTLRANLLNGNMTVSGYDGKDVVIETRGGTSNSRHVPRGAEGMKRIDAGGGTVSAEEENNTIRVRGPMNGSLVIKVPYSTSLKLECTNGGDLKVDHVSGDLELSNLNGNVVASDVSGSVVAHSLNGKVLVTFDKVAVDKAMSFSTMNGDVDVTLPQDVKAGVRMKSDNGDAFSDFDIKLNPSASAPQVEDGRSKGGKYKVKLEKSTVGSINGGGPELTFKTYNGNIYIRKKK